MGSWEQRWWQHDGTTSLPRRDRRSGAYDTYRPDTLVGAPLALDRATDLLVAAAERQVRESDVESRDHAGISRFLLRSEAIASSRIEGIAPSARQVALAELGQNETVRGVGEQAQLVANNMTVVREATTRLVEIDRVSTEDLLSLHRSLLPGEPAHHGIRQVQNWIGGSDWHPLEAEFVPPAPEHVPSLLEDLVDYLGGAQHSPLVQAALVHAQFETIHPFTDGNGRVGRALIHTVLARRGLVSDAVLPVSLVLSTLRGRYVEGLTTYRLDAPADSPESIAARGGWIALFADVTVLACEQAQRIAAELREVRATWEARLTSHRDSQGATRALRRDSATAAILADLPATPLVTVATASRIHDVSRVAAGRALEELHAAGIVGSRSIGSGRHAYVAEDALDLITWAERRLASTRLDTRVNPPRPGFPAKPQD